MKRWSAPLVMIAALAAVCQPHGHAASYDFETHELDNGLRVVTLEDFSSPLVAVQVWYHVGSKDERPDRQGFAHMFEHMMFRGTERLGPEEHFDLLRGVGGYVNAFTSFDYTAYVNTIPPNQLELALWLEAERMMYLRIDQEGFETERQVVIEERRQYLNQPYGTVFERIMPVLFTQHPYQWMTIGQIEHLMAASVDELRAFWNAYYVPNNATLVIAGAVKGDEARAMAERYFGWMPRYPDPPRVAIREPEQNGLRSAQIPEPMGPVPLVRVIHRTIPVNHADHTALRLLANILGEGDSSRLYNDLVKERRICQDAGAWLWGLEQDGLLMAGAELMADGDADAVEAEVIAHIERLIREPVTERELEKAKNQLRRSVVTSQLTVSDKARAIGKTAIEHGSPDWLNEELAAIEAATIEDLQRAAASYLTETRRTVVRVTPDPSWSHSAPPAEPVDEAPAPVERAQVQRPDWFPEHPPVQPLLDDLTLPDTTSETLDNGLRVTVLQDERLPFVTVKLGLEHGPRTEDPDTPGVAATALAQLTAGTERHTAAELAELIEFNALTINGTPSMFSASGMDACEVQATALKDKLPLAVELLAEVVRRPTFPESELEIRLNQTRLSLSVQEEDARYLASRELRRRLHGDHPYARTPTGELADLDGITRDAVAAWWRRSARPDAASLYFAGAVTPEEAFELAKTHFSGAWTEAEPPSVDAPAPPEPEPTRIYLLDRPNAVQTRIHIGQRSITRGHPDYHLSRVYSTILGGGFNSRLNRVIRIERGLTYAVSGQITPDRDTGSFLCITFTKPETAGEAVQAILDVITDMRDNPPEGDELEDAKAYLVGSFARTIETPADVIMNQWMIDYTGLPDDYLQQAVDGYKRVTTEDLARFAREHVDPDRLTIVVAGDADALRAQLEPIAPVTVVSPEDAAAPETPEAALPAGEY